MVAVIEPPASSTPSISVKQRIEQLKHSVSASKLSTWQTCRMKFYFRYVLRLKAAKSSARYVGSMVHVILKQWNLARWRNQPTSPDALRADLEQRWTTDDEYQDVEWSAGEEAESKQAAWRLLDFYLRHTPIPDNEKVEGVEVSAEADLAKHGLPTLIGVIDLVRQGGTVVDYKTVRQTPHQDRAAHLNETQLSCYSVLYREATGRKEAALELHNLVKLKFPRLVVVPIAASTDVQISRLYRLIDSYLTGLDRQDFIPSPNAMNCACCEFFEQCRNSR